MYKNYLVISLITFGIISTNAFADPLPLTNAEIVKLKHYFPVNDDNTHLVWKGDPLNVQLPLNQEKRIVFPTHVTFDAKSALTTDQLRIINNDKSLYLTALKPINNVRVYVTLQDSNEVVLIDLSTTEKASNSKTTIDIQQNNINQSLSSSTIKNITLPSTFAPDTNEGMSSGNDNEVVLTRFAWQQLFAPNRLLNNSLGISRAPMHTVPFVSTLVYGDKVIAHPVISWMYNNSYVTAIELRNKYPHPTSINVNRDLCGDWQAATLYPRNYLASAGDKTGDNTTLFLISSKPFGNSMEVCNAHA